MKQICISAMLQSQQCWLPQLDEPLGFETAVKTLPANQRFIAHCMENNERQNLADRKRGNEPAIFIGPEGDFTPGEIEFALQNGWVPVSLGDTRLRSETAGVVGGVLLLNG
jgi:16S rRNA (uracil1498-N3)-methyltransferase